MVHECGGIEYDALMTAMIAIALRDRIKSIHTTTSPRSNWEDGNLED